ncbi:MAG: DNA polymerase III subunit gamma/tau [Clostridia bacterium]|nr:DNA polymerase III subunit gamma/tau [Clostridia bacterium]
MEHIALYRLFRPMTFDEIVEQDGPVSSLRQAVKTGRIGHAYLFSGQRGTGKTSIAKVFSRAVNCENPVNGNPCNQCAICKGIIDGSLMDVIEIDAASNNSVENIRRICEEVVFAPSKAKKKVYIIDEVHMLSQGAFNALLKTLEEPPAHVIFLFATTEPHRIPATILSRCQRFEFKRITIDSLVKRLRFICDREGFKAEDDALTLIASLSDGAMRDAVSLLDQTGNSNLEKKVTRDGVLKITGTVDDEFLGKMAGALLGGDFETLLNLCEELANSGRDIIRFSLDLAQYFRDLLVVRMMPDPVKLLKVSTSSLATMYDICKDTNAETLAGYISKLSAMISDLKWSPSVRTSFEISLINLCGRKVKLDTVPLVVPDFVKKQQEAAKKIAEEKAKELEAAKAKEEAPKASEEPKKEEPSKQEEPAKEEDPSKAEEPKKDEPEKKEEEKKEAEPSVLFPSLSNLSVTPSAEPKKEEPAEPVKEKEEEKLPEPPIPPVPPVPAEPVDPEDVPMENQIDLFSVPPIEEPKKEETKEAPAPAPADEGAPLLSMLSDSFLDDLVKGTEPTITHYEPDVPEPPMPDPEEEDYRPQPTTSLVQLMEGQELPVKKEPERSEGADLDAIWQSIYSQVIGDNYMLYATLSETKLKQENEKVFILFDDSYTKQSLKELTSDPLYMKIRNDILTVLPGSRKVYVATPTMLENLKNATSSADGVVNAPEKEKTKLEGYLDKAEQLGIDIHFGDD